MWNQPSRSACAVASGRFRYPLNRLGPRTITSPIVSPSAASSSRPSSSTSRTSTPGTGTPDAPGPACAVGAHRQVHQRLGHAVALDDLLAGQPADALELGSRKRGRPGHQQARAAQSPAATRSRLGRAPEAVIHRRHPEQHRAAVAKRRRRRVRCEPAEVAKRATSAQRTEQSEHQAMNVKQRQPVDDDIVRGPGPGLRRARRGSR